LDNISVLQPQFASPWANQTESRKDNPRHNSSRDSPFD